MNIDVKLTQAALKFKHMVVVDLSFPKSSFPEFKKLYEQRYIHLPCKEEMVLAFAAGLASTGKLVVLYGTNLDLSGDEFFDSTLNIKVLKESSGGTYESLDSGLKEFGSAVLLIPLAI